MWEGPQCPDAGTIKSGRIPRPGIWGQGTATSALGCESSSRVDQPEGCGPLQPLLVVRAAGNGCLVGGGLRTRTRGSTSTDPLRAHSC